LHGPGLTLVVVAQLPPAKFSALATKKARRPRILIDVRAERFAKQGRIAGALNIDLDSLRYRAYAVAERNDLVLVYGQEEADSRKGAIAVESMGYGDVRYLAGGFTAWTAAKLPVDTGDLLEVKGPVGFKAAPAFGPDVRGEWKTLPP